MPNIRLLIQHLPKFHSKSNHKAVFCLRRELPRCQIIITIVISCTRVKYEYVSENHKAWQLCSLLLWNYYCHYTTYVAYEWSAYYIPEFVCYMPVYYINLLLFIYLIWISDWRKWCEHMYMHMFTWMMARGVVISERALICCFKCLLWICCETLKGFINVDE